LTHFDLENDMKRGLKLSRDLIDKFNLELSGFNVLTECASMGYGFTPVLARLAGAKVHCVGRDSKYGEFEANKAFIKQILAKLNITDGVEFHSKMFPNSVLNDGDIVLNNGFVRPISKLIVQELRKTAVIALMWETWEFRSQDLDLMACQKNRIPVIGTNESSELLQMFQYNGMIALKLLFQMGIEVHNNRIALLGGYKTGESIAKAFDGLGVDYIWFTTTGEERPEDCFSYTELSELLNIRNIDAVVCAEHHDHNCLVGKNGYIDFHQIRNAHPGLRWGHLCGNIEAEALEKSGVFYYPEKILPNGYMSYQAFDLGIRPVLELNAAGLKVGEIAAKARCAGLSIEKTINSTILAGIGMDFPGGFLNYHA
jgi:hypothetical protein